MEVYFSHPYASHERGTNENFNSLLRDFLPKGVSFNSLTTEELNHYVSAINDRHRQIHRYKTANILFWASPNSLTSGTLVINELDALELTREGKFFRCQKKSSEKFQRIHY